MFDFLKKKEKAQWSDSDVLAPASGAVIPASEIRDEVFAKEMLGKTLAIEPIEGRFVSPANGTLEVMFPTGHAYAVRMKDGTALLIHIGINTVNLKGNGFHVYAKQGESVTAGQLLVKADLNAIRTAGLETTTMLIITESPKDHAISFADRDRVSAGEKINL